MKDQFGRNIDYIRISVTDRCNLRCIYCMPEKGVKQVRREDILQYDEIVRLCKIFAGLGISKIKLTGGEPLVRRGLSALVADIKAIQGIESVTLTTNGVLLKDQLSDLIHAGIDAINVSLDALDEKIYADIARKSALPVVLEGIRESLKIPGLRMKINCVPLAGVNEDQWVPLALMAKDSELHVRFIEMMPIGLGKDHQGSTQNAVMEKLTDAFGEAVPVRGHFGNGPSVYVQFAGFRGKIGFISAMTHQFCDECNRIRLTSEGYLKLCLQYSDGVDLREPLRNGHTDFELSSLIEKTIKVKRQGHCFITSEPVGNLEKDFEKRQMSEIGG